ncbi:MAG: acetyl-CoA hydrolase/transferase C-terminal domain-containing protein [Dehalococcoidales bacterium]
MAGDWKEEFRRKTVSAEEAVRVIKSGDRVSFTHGREPPTVTCAMVARKNELKNVKVFMRTPSLDFPWYHEDWNDSFPLEISYVRPIARNIMAERRVDFVPGSLIGITPQNPQVGDADVLLIELSPPDGQGFCSFGASVWGKKKAVQCAKIVIAEINQSFIHTFGDNAIHVSEIDYFVEQTTGRSSGVSEQLGRKAPEIGPEEQSIAGYAGSLIQDGDTLQIGVGSAAECLAQNGNLNNKTDLGWHSETTPRGIIPLVRNGVITGKRKTINTGKLVAIALGGSEEDMKFVDRNPLFELYDSDYVLDPRVVSANDRFVGINAAVAVDLTGQIAAESVGPAILSGPGGQLTFAIGAQLSKGGRFITTLQSTARGGKFSRIVPMLQEGSMVTVPRTLADIVVTEFGIARLRGKTHRERALELIAVAHPDFRAELKRQAGDMFWP